MPPLTRRTFLQAMAAMPLTPWMSRLTSARVPWVRHDVASPEGKRMLDIYARSVAAMQALPANDPCSWTWQWYTHFVDGNTNKAAEIDRIFGGPSGELAALAEAMWNTCQSHAGQDPNHFLPWHRMFLFYLEAIVREISGRRDFAMPYWNYSSDDPARRGVLPGEFRKPADPVFGALYRPDRNQAANAGQPIHGGQPGDPMDVNATMSISGYGTEGVAQGFCRSIDSGIHTRIHVLVGNLDNMGTVPFAGRDPLFWVHHSNIDRLWDRWTRDGGVNPSGAEWAGRTFTFADSRGRKVERPLGAFFDLAQLGYEYDDTHLPLAKSGGGAARVPANVRRPTTTAIGRAAHLTARPLHVDLVAGRGPRVATAPAAGKRTYLVLKDLHAWAQPGVLYHVYLGTRRDGGRMAAAGHVGNINFFDAQFHDHGTHAQDMALGENFFSFDVTARLQALARVRRNDKQDALVVTIAPAGVPARNAKPVVATIALVEQ